MIFKPALMLPVRFIDINNINNSFDGDFAINQIGTWQMQNVCYNQKFQSSDTLCLQLISDLPLNDLIIYSKDGNIVDSVPWSVSTITLIDFPTFSIYEIRYNLNTLPDGIYILQQDNFESEPIEVKQNQENTILIKYKHSDNDKDVIFDTGIEFQFRVEAWIGDYQPKNDRQVYLDQQQAPTQLNSVAYRQFRLYIGFKWGVPNWVLDKVNILTQCDTVKYNDVEYTPIDGAEFEKIQDDLYAFVGGTLEIQSINRFLKLNTGNLPTNNQFIPAQMVKLYNNVSTNIVVSNVFRLFSLLEKIVVNKNSSPNFLMNVGITSGGNEIGSLNVTNNGNVLNINYDFTTSETLYISGLTGNNCDVALIWKQLDEPPIPFNPTPQDALPKCAKMIWEGSPTEFAQKWDTTTGLGKPNEGWEKWTIAGKNGTVSMDNAYPVGIDTSVSGQDYLTLGNTIGANNKKILKANLPNEGIQLLTGIVGTDGNINNTTPLARARSVGSQALNYEMVKGSGTPSIGLSGPLGSGEDMNVQPKSIISLWIVKIQD